MVLVPKLSRATQKRKSGKVEEIRPLTDLLLRGYILCIDPSIGSSSSYCGYAIYEEGKCIEVGCIPVKLGVSHSARLFELTTSLRTDFRKPDVLLIEQISPFRGGRINTTLILNRVIGAVLSVWDMGDNVIEVPPQLWHSYTDRANYVKSDSSDAMMVGYSILQIARELRGEVVTSQVAQIRLSLEGDTDKSQVEGGKVRSGKKLKMKGKKSGKKVGKVGRSKIKGKRR